MPQQRAAWLHRLLLGPTALKLRQDAAFCSSQQADALVTLWVAVQGRETRSPLPSFLLSKRSHTSCSGSPAGLTITHLFLLAAPAGGSSDPCRSEFFPLVIPLSDFSESHGSFKELLPVGAVKPPALRAASLKTPLLWQMPGCKSWSFSFN